MESATFHLHSEDLDETVMKSIRTLFPGYITISVERQEPKEITNPELLARIRESEESDFSYVLEPDEWAKLMQKVEEDAPSEEIIDFIATHKVYK